MWVECCCQNIHETNTCILVFVCKHLLLISTDITTMSERIAAFNCFKMPPVIESNAIVHEEKVSRDCLYYCKVIHKFIYLKVFMIAEKMLFLLLIIKYFIFFFSWNRGAEIIECLMSLFASRITMIIMSLTMMIILLIIISFIIGLLLLCEGWRAVVTFVMTLSHSSQTMLRNILLYGSLLRSKFEHYWC